MAYNARKVRFSLLTDIGLESEHFVPEADIAVVRLS